MACQLWDFDDFLRCGREYFITYVPATVGILSLLLLVVKLALLKWHGSIQLDESLETAPLLAVNDVYGAVSEPDVHPKVHISLKDRHFNLTTLADTTDDGLPHGVVQEVPKGTADRIRVLVEFVAVFLQLCLATAGAFFFTGFKREWGPLSLRLILPLYWAYAFVLVLLRLVNLSKVRVRLPLLWAHLTALYLGNLVGCVVLFRSALIGHVDSDLVLKFYYVNFALTLVLCWLNVTASVGDKPGKIYVASDGSTPSPENITSLWGFLSYSWIDPMIKKAYRNPLSKDDIWGLRGDDYALAVLKSFKGLALASRFTFKLFYHFKWLFALQGFWALLDSVLIFVPTLLLQRVLEYIADPSSSTKSVAWCLVVLMPLAKMADSVVSGYSLYLGRRVCVRMRAIIIGEVYAKALRRKITVQDDAVDVVKTESKDSTDVADVSDKNDNGPNSAADSTDTETQKDEKKEGKTAELGAIINLMAIDAFKVSEICGYLHYFVGAILSLVFCILLLYRLLGWSAMVGALVVIALLPVNYKVASWVALAQKTMLSVTDRRIQKMNETFSSIRIIKFFAWEDNFFRDIMKIRHEELHYLKLRSFLWGCQAFVWLIIPTLVTVVSFYCYTIIDGNQLTAPVAFTALSLFTLLRSPLDQLADMTAIVIQSKVSLDRVSDFLEEKETSKYEQLGQDRDASLPEIGFEDATFAWNSANASDFKLKDINVAFQPGKLNVVIGPTGAGKTSLLLALLGEMELVSGKVFLPGIIPRDDLIVNPTTGLTESVAYCSQSAWLLNETIRNNIIFNAPFNQARYDRVVEACGLKRDLQILSAGDLTEIGEKGIALSGGQKQRVSLARALYSNSRHVILDDCLSAVDSHTALWIYEHCITGPLMANRTCILVSHNVALTVQAASWVVVMDNGRVSVQGTPDELLSAGHLGDDEMIKTSVLTSRNQSSTSLAADATKADLVAKAAAIESKLAALAGEDEVEAKTDGKLVEEENKAEGVVGLKVYADYAREFGGWPMWTLIVLVFLVPQAVYIIQSYWLKMWAQAGQVHIESLSAVSALGSNFVTPLRNSAVVAVPAQVFSNTVDRVQLFKEENSTLYYISVYALIGMAYGILATFRIFLTFLAGIRASNRIFKQVTTRVLRANLRFFDKTPLGRIMNRFSKDIESVDQELTPFAEGAFACIVSCLSILFLITAITPGFLFFAFVIAYLYYFVGTYYITLSRELKRYDSITKSPIHQHFSESLTGVATIRAYGVESRFMKQNLNAIDNNNRPFFYMWVANRWLMFRTDAVGSLVMLFAGVFIILSVGHIDAGLAGLSLSYAISFSESALWVVRLYANIEMNMNSVERLQEFTHIEEEPPAEIPENVPRSTWPEKGEIEVKDVSLRYAPELPRVIKNVSFHVEPCNKIGIVGRTGAGKSTIITAFFRFLDPETGSIHIDGVDIAKIGLKNLREAITIIPQDPTLFTGTIRSNLDPFDQYTDEQIFEALGRVNLIAPGEREAASSDSSSGLGENKNKFLDIELAISEGGNNLSQGQRQLMCLARSLLKSPKVILLDEATASIDYKSDAMIQRTIRDEFSSSSILTIAHRLRSIIDYDKILVMDAGKVVEYDDPYVLIADKSTLFHSMCENSGEMDSLVKLAKEAFVKKKNSA